MPELTLYTDLFLFIKTFKGNFMYENKVFLYNLNKYFVSDISDIIISYTYSYHFVQKMLVEEYIIITDVLDTIMLYCT